jgi:hypothetical protein
MLRWHVGGTYRGSLGASSNDRGGGDIVADEARTRRESEPTGAQRELTPIAQPRALKMGLHRRRPEPGLVHHSDLGAQHVSLAFGQQARDAGIAVSRGSRVDAYDNAVAESFFATLKKELVHRQPWPTKRELDAAVFEYIEGFYNRQRRHSTLGYLTPEKFKREKITTTTND